jgi:FAD synthase
MFIEQELIRLAPRKGTFLTVGTFDGVHLGHRHLIEELNKYAEDDNLLSGVITFDSPPQSILFPQRECLYIDRAKDRINLLETSGAAMVFVLPFSPVVARLSAQEFVELLSKHLKMRGLLVGPNFALGRKREGNLNLLRALGEKLGFRVEASSPFFLNGQLVSSSAIRQALSTGNVALAKNYWEGISAYKLRSPLQTNADGS